MALGAALAFETRHDGCHFVKAIADGLTPFLFFGGTLAKGRWGDATELGPTGYRLGWESLYMGRIGSTSWPVGWIRTRGNVILTLLFFCQPGLLLLAVGAVAWR